MKRIGSILLAAIMVFAALTMLTSSVAQAQIQPTISTDKADYAPSEIVTISGSGFSANAHIKVEVTAPDPTGNAVSYATCDSKGDFTTTYGQPPPLVEGVYTVVATDQENPASTATTTFTDKVQKNVSVSATFGGSVTFSPIGTGSGVVGAETTSHFTVSSGSHMIFIAIPKDGFTFEGWTIDGHKSNANPLSKEVGNGIGSLTATFCPQLVVPEYPLGALAALGACFIGFAVFKKRNNLVHF